MALQASEFLSTQLISAKNKHLQYLMPQFSHTQNWGSDAPFPRAFAESAEQNSEGAMIFFCMVPLPEGTKRFENCTTPHSCWEMGETEQEALCILTWSELWHSKVDCWYSVCDTKHLQFQSCMSQTKAVGFTALIFLPSSFSCGTGFGSLPFVGLGDFPWFNVKKGCCWRSVRMQFTLKMWKQRVYICVSFQGVSPSCQMPSLSWISLWNSDYRHPISSISNTDPAGSAGSIKRNNSKAHSASGGLRGWLCFGIHSEPGLQITCFLKELTGRTAPFP